MTQSQAVGPFRVRPHLRNGAKTGKWFVDVPASLTSTGKRKRKLFDNQEMALAAANALQSKLDQVMKCGSAHEAYADISADNRAHCFADAADGWLADQEIRVQTLKKRVTTLKNEEFRLRAACAFFGKTLLPLINEKRLEGYQLARLQEGRSPVTINSDMRSIRQVLAWAQERNWIRFVPKIDPIPIRKKRNKKAIVIPTPEEVVRIIGHMPNHLKLLIWFLAETGCRRSEAIKLTWDCVDAEDGCIDIVSRDGYTPKTENAERTVHLSKRLLTALLETRANNIYVFPGDAPDKPLGQFRKSWASAVDKARIIRRGRQVHVLVKWLRKAHATWQSERGLPESVLQDRLGHAPGSTVTREYYVTTTDQARKAAVFALPTGDSSIDS